jgi:hypothetical protein
MILFDGLIIKLNTLSNSTIKIVTSVKLEIKCMTKWQPTTGLKFGLKKERMMELGI